MQFTSIAFLIFMLLTAAVEFMLPQRARSRWLFAVSLVFYACLDIRYIPLLIAVILTAYLGGQAAAAERGRSSTAFAVSVIIEVSLLVLFKCAGFFIDRSDSLKSLLSGGSPDIFVYIVPIGISFYILQAIGYLADCHRGDIPAERDLADLGLFISFFPQLTSGPIERAPRMLPQYRKGPEGFDADRVRDGAMYMLWGYFLKLVLADRIAILVDRFYSSPDSYGGAVAAIAVVLYMVQLYCDFSGYSAIAIGAAKVLGVSLCENFNSPFLSGSVSEFWRRWHISLSTWLRDYVYIPLGGNRKGTARKWINILIVFVVSGFWHGAGGRFIIWGLIFGVLQILGSVLKPLRDTAVKTLGLNRNSFAHRNIKRAAVFLMVAGTFVFFRAASIKDALLVFSRLRTPRLYELTGEALTGMGLDLPNMVLMAAGIAIMIFADVCRFKGICLREKLCIQSLPFRWAVLIFAVVLIAVCGIWGPGYSADSFIYAHF